MLVFAGGTDLGAVIIMMQVGDGRRAIGVKARDDGFHIRSCPLRVRTLPLLRSRSTQICAVSRAGTTSSRLTS
jgi:hypothetical protein